MKRLNDQFIIGVDHGYDEGTMMLYITAGGPSTGQWSI